MTVPPALTNTGLPDTVPTLYSVVGVGVWSVNLPCLGRFWVQANGGDKALSGPPLSFCYQNLGSETRPLCPLLYRFLEAGVYCSAHRHFRPSASDHPGAGRSDPCQQGAPKIRWQSWESAPCQARALGHSQAPALHANEDVQGPECDWPPSRTRRAAGLGCADAGGK